MKKRPDFTNMKTREILEYLFDELEEEEEESKAQLYEWRSEPNACKKCAKHDRNFFTLEEAPIMHPNCKCDLVATINGKKVTMPVGELSKKKYEEQKAKSHKTVDVVRKEQHISNKYQCKPLTTPATDSSWRYNPNVNAYCQKKGDYLYCDIPATRTEDALKVIKHNLYVSEGKNVTKPYIDTNGKPTIGPGFLVTSRAELENYPLRRKSASNRLLTSAEKDELWDKLIAFRKSKCMIDKKGKYSCNIAARHQTDFDDYWVFPEDIDRIMDKKLKEDYYKPAKQSFKNAGFNLEQIGLPMLELLVNGQYNEGLGFNQIRGGTNAFQNGDWAHILNAYLNKDIQNDRKNHYVELLCREMQHQNKLRSK